MRTAFGAPVVPDVKISMKMSAGDDLDVGERRARVRRERVVPLGRVDDEQRVGGHDVARALEQVEVRRLGHEQRAVGVLRGRGRARRRAGSG